MEKNLSMIDRRLTMTLISLLKRPGKWLHRCLINNMNVWRYVGLRTIKFTFFFVVQDESLTKLMSFTLRHFLLHLLGNPHRGRVEGVAVIAVNWGKCRFQYGLVFDYNCGWKGRARAWIEKGRIKDVSRCRIITQIKFTIHLIKK